MKNGSMRGTNNERKTFEMAVEAVGGGGPDHSRIHSADPGTWICGADRKSVV